MDYECVLFLTSMLYLLMPSHTKCKAEVTITYPLGADSSQSVYR